MWYYQSFYIRWILECSSDDSSWTIYCDDLTWISLFHIHECVESAHEQVQNTHQQQFFSCFLLQHVEHVEAKVAGINMACIEM